MDSRKSADVVKSIHHSVFLKPSLLPRGCLRDEPSADPKKKPRIAWNDEVDSSEIATHSLPFEQGCQRVGQVHEQTTRYNAIREPVIKRKL